MDSTGIRGRSRVFVAMAVLYAVWGSVFLANRFSLESFPPFALNAVRFLSAGTVLYFYLRLKGEGRISLRGWLQSFLIGGLLFIGGAGLLCVGQQWVASGLSATLIATVPLWTVLFAGIWGKLPSKMEWAGLALGLGGVGLLNLEKGISGHPLGALAIIGAAVSWGLGSILNNRFNDLARPIAAATEMVAGGILLLAVSLILGEKILLPITLRAALGMVHLSFFASIIGFTIYRFLLRSVRPTLATSYALVNPVTATILGVLFAGESISSVSLSAMAVILAGVALVFRARSI
ncbi:MAG TPA: drug/metabolite exporter YedA [Synergistetes bacterium]|nr:drug/metabolite exporter YedA [Synergistota bacterium]